MPGTENKVIVNIFGEDYPITGVVDPSHISRVADYVDSKMRETAEHSHSVSRDRIAILAAMSIASEMLEKSVRSGRDRESFDDQADNILARLEQGLVG